jgi:hypothetical protein
MGGRLALMVGAGIALMAGLDAALLQLGVAAPVTSERVAAVHGMLMVLGFIGTVIALERAVALGKKWGFTAPAFMGLGGVALISPLPLTAAGALLMVGTGVQAVIFFPLWRRRRDAAVLVQALGAASAFGAAMLFTGGAATPAFLGWLIGGPAVGGPMYDLVIHSVFLGFVISMIMAHAPVILPAVLRRPLPYHPVMYLPAALLHVALAVRIVGGDLKGARLVWQVGGVGNVIAVLAFALTAVVTGVTASLAARRRRQRTLRQQAAAGGE